VDADCVYLWMYFALSVPVAVLGSLETSFETLGCSEARVLPCTCWCELSTQIFGEERRSLDSLGEQGMCVVGQVTDGVEEDVASAAVVELGAFFLASVAVVAVEAEQVAAQVPLLAEQVARVPFVAARAPVELDAVLLAEEVAAVLELGVAGDVELGAVDVAVELGAVVLALAAVPRLLFVVLLEPCQQVVKCLCWSGASDPICVLELLN
jgi:hypothetical protein